MARRKTIADAEAAEAARFLAGATDVGPLDPVDVAIAAHRAAWAELSVVLDKTRGAMHGSKRHDRLMEARNLYARRTDVLVEAPLATMAQVVAFGSYIASLEAYGPRPDPYPYQIGVGPLFDAMSNVAGALERLSASQQAAPVLHIRLAA